MSKAGYEVQAAYRAIRSKYAEARRILSEQERQELAQIQATCPHSFKYQQVAGEGRFCIYCNLEVDEED